MSAKEKFNVQVISDAAKEQIWKIYPILFSDGENNFPLGHPTDSSIGDLRKYENRKNLIISALKYDSQPKKTKMVPIE